MTPTRLWIQLGSASALTRDGGGPYIEITIQDRLYPAVG